MNKTLSMVCTLDWPANITAAPYGPGVGGSVEKKTLVLKSDTALFHLGFKLLF